MNPENKIYVGQPLKVKLTVLDENGVILDVSTATVKSIVFRRPNGSKITTVAAFTNTGTDGEIEFDLTTELDIHGLWKAQGLVTLAGKEWPTSDIEFKVHNRI